MMQRLLTIALSGLALAALAVPAQALPRMTLTTSSRCSNCHINPQGSGPRNAMGFYATAANGAVTWDKLGWQKFHELSDNTFFGEKLEIGGDLRLQMAKLGQPRWDTNGKIVEPDRMFIPMQDQVGINYKALPWLSVAASFNPIGFLKSYAGQSLYDGWVQIQPSVELPRLRVGMIQPGFGVRYDDHTLVIRRNPFALGTPILPPFYNDLGAELAYEGLHWLSLDVSAVWANNLHLANPDGVGSGQLALSARATLYPQTQDWGVNSWLGASYLQSDKLTMYGGHVGLGKSYWGSIMGEAVWSQVAFGRETFSTLVQVDHPVKEWLVLTGRWETGNGRSPGLAEADVQSYVAGIQFIPLPNIELRPEYRYLKTSTYLLAQYTLQLHAWF